MDNYPLAFLVLLISFFLSRLVNNHAIKKLEVHEKAALVDLFSTNRSWTFGILIAIFAFYFVSLKYELLDIYWTNILYISVLFIYMTAMAVYAFKNLKEQNFPDAYIKSYILSTAIRFVGLGVFLAVLGGLG